MKCFLVVWFIYFSRYARYTPNIGMKKRGPGRPRLLPDPLMATSSMTMKQKPPAIPAQILLTDALSKLNKQNATNVVRFLPIKMSFLIVNVLVLSLLFFKVKIHIKQVTHDILANMELNPNYNLVLTAKHDLPQEHSLEELVKEWEEKEVEHSEEKVCFLSPNLYSCHVT